MKFFFIFNILIFLLSNQKEIDKTNYKNPTSPQNSKKSVKTPSKNNIITGNKQPIPVINYEQMKKKYASLINKKKQPIKSKKELNNIIKEQLEKNLKNEQLLLQQKYEEEKQYEEERQNKKQRKKSKKKTHKKKEKKEIEYPIIEDTCDNPKRNFFYPNEPEHLKKSKKFDFHKMPPFTHKSQTLKLVLPSERCRIKEPTVYFNNNFELNPNFPENKYKFEIRTITDKNYFVTIYGGSTNCLTHGIYRTYDLSLANYILVGRHRDIYPKFLNIKQRRREQVYNHHIISHHLRKNQLYMYYEKLRDKFPDDYNFMTFHYILPRDIALAKKFFSKYTPKKDDLWLYKPSGSLKGYGISFQLKDNIKSSGIITKYIDNPFLLQGRKFDMRIHVLVASVDPFRMYIHDNGFVRISVDTFKLDYKNLNNELHVHLSCGGNNKKTGRYVYNPDYNKEYGNLWSLRVLKRHIDTRGFNATKVFNDINDIIIKSVISFVDKEKKMLKEKNWDPHNDYTFLGADVMLDENLKPYLLEMNTAADRVWEFHGKEISSQTVRDEFNTVGFKIFDHSNPNKEEYYHDVVEEALCEFDRPTGGFVRVFPRVENVNYYKKFFIPTKNDYRLWKLMEERGFD